MRVIIIDPFLLNYSGHNYNLVVDITEALEKKNINFIVLANSMADVSCLKIKNCYPCLISVADKAFKITYSFWNFFGMCAAIKLLIDGLNKVLLHNSSFKIENKDIFYFHSPYIFELFSLGLFMLWKRKIFIKKRCIFFLGLNFPYIRKSIFSTILFGIAYKVVCNIIIEFSGIKVIYFSAGRELKEDYQKLLGKKVEIIFEPTNIIYEGKSKTIAEKDKTRISYIGSARFNKGFDMLVKMMVHLVDDSEMMEKNFFVIQIDVQDKSQTKSEREKTCHAVERLKDIAKTSKNVRLIYGTLPPKEYYTELSYSDVVLLLHRSAFRRVHSKTFIETILAGKVPVVSENTTSADYLKEEKLDGLIFKENNVFDLINVLKHAVYNYQEYKRKIEPISKKWREFYSGDNFIYTLLKLTK